jgi:hypothetical protein
MTETNEQVTATAERMLSMYGRSKYTPEQRATDHAFAYDRHDEGRKFWIEVLKAIYRIKDGGNR